MNRSEIQKERAGVRRHSIAAQFLAVVSCMAIAAMFTVAGAQEKDSADQQPLKLITSRSGATLTVSKAELSTRPDREGTARNSSRRLLPSTDVAPTPTALKLYFPTLVDPGQRVSGKLVFNDADDYVFAIFITVFFPDGDVVSDTLYDYRIDGGDIYKGTYRFSIDMPDSTTPLPGRIVITCSDEYLNVSEISQNFVLYY